MWAKTLNKSPRAKTPERQRTREAYPGGPPAKSLQLASRLARWSISEGSLPKETGTKRKMSHQDEKIIDGAQSLQAQQAQQQKNPLDTPKDIDLGSSDVTMTSVLSAGAGGDGGQPVTLDSLAESLKSLAVGLGETRSALKETHNHVQSHATFLNEVFEGQQRQARCLNSNNKCF